MNVLRDAFIVISEKLTSLQAPKYVLLGRQVLYKIGSFFGGVFCGSQQKQNVLLSIASRYSFSTRIKRIAC